MKKHHLMLVHLFLKTLSLKMWVVNVIGFLKKKSLAV